ncbi:TIGR03767 family metallophosphoesterase [Streptomyces sp. ACA25]|uniref:TIGR03767 family metallophosphoesterase n=1 Tax=Streptomyces sp. ACA25 TaxID=3022596 RepID=UPI002307A121|nr:TIGR03767 family metallophosphoesterase [Streptomyces sp. ACA25]MDB1086729.1 TIGR03767 family metallophosphoesterase [Streptomyces sp. ACA25]
MPGAQRFTETVADRRTVLGAVGGAALATAGAVALSGRRGRAEAQDERTGPASGEHAEAGTTLERVATGSGTGPYRQLTAGSGWPRVLREDLVAARSGRQGRGTPLAAFVQFTDTHVTDVQHPVRFEMLRSAWLPGWRPQEALTVQGLVSLVEKVNTLRTGPATGEPLGFVMTTGDNTDNNSRNELEWFLTVMTGGRITPNSGDPQRYEGVQNSGLTQFWQPEDELADVDKQLGFPHIEGFLRAAVREVNSPGLTVPWYSTVGNHDALPGGCYGRGDGAAAELAVGDRKLLELPGDVARPLRESLRAGDDPLGEGYFEVTRRHARSMRPVTADESRAPFTHRGYAEAHLEERFTGAGPRGHGYEAEDAAAGRLHYSFRIADGVLGISLDTTVPGGHWQGSLGTRQLRWLAALLEQHADDHVLVFSHHASWSMTNGSPDPEHPDEERHLGEELVALLQRHRNVLAWISGHSHRNRIVARETFWEINTASHVDHPQLARVVELTDNGDGTLSLFTTLIESGAPYATTPEDLSQTGLAAYYRELAFNAPGAPLDERLGAPKDLNAELLVPKR